MSQAEALYRLQTIDLQIEEKRRRMRDIEAGLGESLALRQARQELAGAEKCLVELHKTLRKQEADVRAAEGKMKADEERLYGGKIGNPKELSGLKHGVDAEKRQISGLEDLVLETMLQIEQVEAEIQNTQDRLRRVQLSWGDEQVRLRRELSDLQVTLAELQDEHEDAGLYVLEQNLKIYNDLRSKKGGRVVAVLEGTLCRGCLVTLPLNDAMRARSSTGITFCTNCGRILYARE